MSLLKVGITGNSGFIGYHLTQFIHALHSDKIEIVPLDAAFFKNPDQLQEFVRQCDVIVHLAAMNRGPDDEVYATNILLVQQLIGALETTGRTPHVILSSSTQEGRDNVIGRAHV